MPLTAASQAAAEAATFPAILMYPWIQETVCVRVPCDIMTGTCFESYAPEDSMSRSSEDHE